MQQISRQPAQQHPRYMANPQNTFPPPQQQQQGVPYVPKTTTDFTQEGGYLAQAKGGLMSGGASAYQLQDSLSAIGGATRGGGGSSGAAELPFQQSKYDMASQSNASVAARGATAADQGIYSTYNNNAAGHGACNNYPQRQNYMRPQQQATPPAHRVPAYGQAAALQNRYEIHKGRGDNMTTNLADPLAQITFEEGWNDCVPHQQQTHEAQRRVAAIAAAPPLQNPASLSTQARMQSDYAHAGYAVPSEAPILSDQQNNVSGGVTGNSNVGPTGAGAAPAAGSASVWTMNTSQLPMSMRLSHDFASQSEIKRAFSVAGEFIWHYFRLMQTQPQMLHCFYCRDSQLAHGSTIWAHQNWHRAFGEADIGALFEDILCAKFNQQGMAGGIMVRSNVKTLEAQPTRDDGIVMQATGNIETRDMGDRPFAHTVVMKRNQDSGSYVVLHDIFVFLDDLILSTGGTPTRQPGLTQTGTMTNITPQDTMPLQTASSHGASPSQYPHKITEKGPVVSQPPTSIHDNQTSPPTTAAKQRQAAPVAIQPESKGRTDPISAVDTTLTVENTDLAAANSSIQPSMPNPSSRVHSLSNDKEQTAPPSPAIGRKQTKKDQQQQQQQQSQQQHQNSAPQEVPLDLKPATVDVATVTVEGGKGGAVVIKPSAQSKPFAWKNIPRQMPKKDKGDEQSANATASEEQENTFEGLPKAPPANEEGGTSSERNNESPEAIDASGFVMEVKMYDAKSYAGRLLTGVKAVPKRVGMVVKRAGGASGGSVAGASASATIPAADGQNGDEHSTPMPNRTVWVSQMEGVSNTQIENAVAARLRGCPVEGRVVRIERMRNGPAGVIELDSPECVPMLLEKGLCINGREVRVDLYKQSPSQISREPNSQRQGGGNKRDADDKRNNDHTQRSAPRGQQQQEGEGQSGGNGGRRFRQGGGRGRQGNNTANRSGSRNEPRSNAAQKKNDEGVVNNYGGGPNLGSERRKMTQNK